MDYSKLSRESLIHEITQLNLEKEQLNLRLIGEALGVNDALNDADAPIFIVSSEYRIQWANKSSLETHQTLIGKKCYQVFWGYDDVCPNCLLLQCVSEQKVNAIEMEAATKDKSVLVQYFPLLRAGQVYGTLEIHLPIHEKKDMLPFYLDQITQLKLQLEALSLKNANTVKLVEKFSKAMRVPLRSFVGYFQAFHQGENEKLKQEYLEILSMSSELLYETLNKLLLFSKFESGEIKGRKESFGLKKMIEETLNQVLMPNQSNRHLTYSFKYAESIPEVLIGDAFNFKQLLSYLLEFVEFVSNHAHVELQISEISQTHSKVVLKLSITSKNHFVSNRVKLITYYDIESNNHYQTIEEYSLALGLSLAKRIVKEQNGILELSSGLDHIFYVNVLLDFDKVVPVNVEPKMTIKQSKPRVLFADFERPQIALDVLKTYDVYFAQTGDEAVSQYLKIDPDLTIINVLIENTDGFSVYDEIEKRRKRKTPIVAISNKLVDNERAFMMDYGFDAYYAKPINNETIEQILETYL